MVAWYVLFAMTRKLLAFGNLRFTESVPQVREALPLSARICASECEGLGVARGWASASAVEIARPNRASLTETRILREKNARGLFSDESRIQLRTINLMLATSIAWLDLTDHYCRDRIQRQASAI
jgi:hypothetical protein